MRHRLALAASATMLLAGVAMLDVGAAAATDPTARTAATCADHPNQASAQRAKDTRDADGDGIYCESLPCPCLAPDPRAGGGGDPKPKPQPRPSPKPQPAPKPQPRPKPEEPRVRAQRIAARITSVIDGNTIRVKTQRGAFERVRLIGIDAPDSRRAGRAVECGAEEAVSHMLELSFPAPQDRDGDELYDDKGDEQGRRVTLLTDPTQDARDEAGRLLAYVTTLTGRNLAREQLAAGWAKVFVFQRRFQQFARFRRASNQAKRRRLGAWDLCGGNFHRRA